MNIMYLNGTSYLNETSYLTETSYLNKTSFHYIEEFLGFIRSLNIMYAITKLKKDKEAQKLIESELRNTYKEISKEEIEVEIKNHSDYFVFRKNNKIVAIIKPLIYTRAELKGEANSYPKQLKYFVSLADKYAEPLYTKYPEFKDLAEDFIDKMDTYVKVLKIDGAKNIIKEKDSSAFLVTDEYFNIKKDFPKNKYKVFCDSVCSNAAIIKK